MLSFLPHAELLSFVAVAAGSYFALQSAAEAIRDRRLDVNILMVVAAIGAIIVHQTRDAAALLFLFSLSSTLEAFAMAKTKSAIAKLVQLRPQTALRIVDGRESQVPVEALHVGDLVRVLPFDKVAIDGEIVEGTSSADESALTGESVPVAKRVGMALVAGTQNLEGTVTMRVTTTVGNSTLDQIIALVADAQENKASGEKISSWFGERYTVFVVIAFALSWIGRSVAGQGTQEAFYSALTLLVGLSPCALVISTPASTLSALAKAARRGILVRGGEFIEKAAQIDYVALDKTGTLTQGKLELAQVAYWDAVTKSVRAWHPGEAVDAGLSEFLAAVATLEQDSGHPIARALVAVAKTAKVPFGRADDSRVVPGQGVEGTVAGRSWGIGSERLFASGSAEGEASLNEIAQTWQGQGQTTVWAKSTGKAAVFGLRDTVRSNAADVVQRMKSLGVRNVVMLTGDRPEAAQTVAASTRVDEVHAGLMPAEKTARIREMAGRGNVMMVGDGVNDAPSLSLATVGVAMGHLGSDIALEAADVVLMQDDLGRIPELIDLGRRTRRIIRTNLLFASGMIVTLAVASFVTKLPLPIAVIGHEGSTVLVILNGLRLLK